MKTLIVLKTLKAGKIHEFKNKMFRIQMNINSPSKT